MASSANMRPLFGNFTRDHLDAFLVFYFSFALVTLLVLIVGSKSIRLDAPQIAATVGALSGPFTGAIAANFQSGCLRFSLRIFPCCALILGVGVLFQIIPLPFPFSERSFRLALWCLGLFGWFGGVLLSLLFLI